MKIRHILSNLFKSEKAENLDTLDGVLDSAWKMLELGAKRFNDPFHWPALGTSENPGSNLRTVILRQFILPDRILVCHTDARAPKVKEIQEFNQVSWLFYHPRDQVQLRITGTAKLHSNDPFADDQWAATGMTSRLNYAATEPPGTSVDRPTSGLPDFLKNKVPTLLESEKGRPNFMAIACQIETLDWLRLNIKGNRRALFTWEENELLAKWIIP